MAPNRHDAAGARRRSSRGRGHFAGRPAKGPRPWLPRRCQASCLRICSRTARSASHFRLTRRPAWSISRAGNTVPPSARTPAAGLQRVELMFHASITTPHLRERRGGPVDQRTCSVCGWTCWASSAGGKTPVVRSLADPAVKPTYDPGIQAAGRQHQSTIWSARPARAVSYGGTGTRFVPAASGGRRDRACDGARLMTCSFRQAGRGGSGLTVRPVQATAGRPACRGIAGGAPLGG